MQRLFLFLSLLLSCWSCSHGPKHTVRVGIDPTWPSLDLGERAPFVQGFLDDVLQAIAEDGSLAIAKIEVNPGELVSSLQRGECDIIISSLSPHIFYEKTYTFSSPLIPTGPILLVHKNTSYRDLNALRGELLGVLQGSSLDLLLLPYPTLIPRSYLTPTELLDALASRQVEGALLPYLLATAYVTNLYPNALRIEDPLLTPEAIRFLAEHHKNTPATEAFFRSASHLAKTQKISSLREKWFFLERIPPS